MEKSSVMGITVSDDQQNSKGHSTLHLSCAGAPLARKVSFDTTYFEAMDQDYNIPTGQKNGNITIVLRIVPANLSKEDSNGWMFPFNAFASIYNSIF